MNITVVGTGYVGLVTGCILSNIGHRVTCLDVDVDKVELMKKGISPIFENGLEELMKKNLKLGRLSFTTRYAEAFKDVEIAVIAVGTPENEDGSANLNYVYQACLELATCIQHDCIVIIKSTVPIGTNDKLEAFIKEHIVHDVKVDVVANPEFLSQGSAVHDLLNAHRIVVGTESLQVENVIREMYAPLGRPIVVTNRRSTEMIKYASNDFLALKISFINDVANLCDIVGANIEDVALGMSYDPRIGDKFLKAGVGYGGSCFPKDTKALHWLATQFDYELKTVIAAIEVNENQKFALIKKANKRFSCFRDLNIAVLGLTFKPGTDDIREAPSIVNVKYLIDNNANIKAFDPEGMNNFKSIFNNQIEYTTSPINALKNADICFIFTEWNEIRELTPSDFITNMKQPIVYDGRNCFNVDMMKNAGIEYYSIGR